MKPLPDILEIQPLAKPPNCTITVPGSKSITNRALILAALSDGKCTLHGALWADDTQVMVDSLQKLGFEVTVEPDPLEECNRTITVVGRGGEIPAKKAELYVGNAGTAARFLTALVCLGHGEYRIAGDSRMNQRPMRDLFDALRQLGVEVEAEKGCLPAVIHARGLKGGEVTISAKQSSQFASALLLIADKAQINLKLAEPDEPYSYVEMTRRMIREFSHDYAIEPDLSSGSYFVTVQAITGGRVKVAGWPRNSLQIDGRFPKFLPPPDFVSRVHDLGDSVMTLAICALFAEVPVVHIVDAERLREQESNRIEAMVTELKKVGAVVGEHADGFSVYHLMPGRQLHGADIETYNDHRMAMCFAVLGLKVPGIRIKNPGCVSKTFPNFFDKLEQLRT
ncbi:MAG: 3-phosphoshikimate 1-carboxyvinyltransferase [Verrucomicrobiia bacterium]